MGLPERPAMRVKGLRVGWRDSRGRGLVDARRGRRDLKMREKSISNEYFFFKDIV